MKDILAKLKHGFNLKEKHISILDALMKKRMKAHEISRMTEIPQGRIYAYLNELIDYGLIEKTAKKPYIYSTEEFNSKVIDFMKSKFNIMVKDQMEIMQIMEKKSKRFEEIEMVSSGEEFSYKAVQLIQESDKINMVIRHGSFPFFLYPANVDDFLKIRRLVSQNRSTLAQTSMELALMMFKAHNEALEQGKEFNIVFEKEDWDYHTGLVRKELGKKFMDKWMKDIKKKLSSYNLKVYVLNEITPMHLIITDKKVFMALIHHGITTGVSIYNSRVVELYDDLFEDIVKRAEKMESLLKQVKTA